MNKAIIKQMIRTFVGNINVKVDRERRVLVITKDGQDNEITFDQAIDYLEELLK